MLIMSGLMLAVTYAIVVTVCCCQTRQLQQHLLLSHTQLQQLQRHLQQQQGQLQVVGFLMAQGLTVDPDLNCFDPAHTKVYLQRLATPDEIAQLGGPGAQHVHWPGPLDRGGEPYYCPPDGWVKLGVRLQHGVDFHAQFRGWPVVYHGTKKDVVEAILRTGFRAGPRATHGKMVYVSPSLTYASHNTYATWWDLANGFEEVQAVFMCRVHPAAFTKCCNTLRHLGFVNCDPNIRDAEIEWTIRPDTPTADGNYASSQQLVITGLMFQRRRKPDA